MYEMKYPHLFTPIRLGNTVFRNRIFCAPTGYMALDAENFPPQEAAEYYGRKAVGGAATVTMGEVTVDSVHGKGSPKNLAIDDPGCVPSLSAVADEIGKHGAVPCIELQHAGMFAAASYQAGHELYGAVEMEVKGTKAGEGLGNVIAQEMPEEVILETIEKYADAALRAKQCGFGMVLVHGGHGWFLSQFMSPVINTRKDRWGGSLENRMRLPLAICRRIKEKCGKGFPIEFRMSGSEVNAGGYDIDEGVRMAQMLDGNVDLIHVSTGNHEVYEAFVVTHPSMFLPDACNLKFAAEIKKHVKTPVATVGAYNDPAQMEEIIASGQADVISLARALIADPDMPTKARMGKPEEIDQCLRCFTCFSNVINRRLFTCAINPEIGRETENKNDLPAAAPRRVLVAGGGVGGMEAALTAANRGHQVILCEKTDRLGGTLLCEDAVPFKGKLKLYLERQARRVQEHPNIQVRMSTEVTPELARSLEPDAIIAALGARPVFPSFIQGADGENVLGAEEAYIHPEKVGQKVVILGGGLVGCELALYLTGMGREVTVLEMLDSINAGDNILQAQAIDVEIAKLGVGRAMGTRALEITDKGVLGQNAGGEQFFDADTVIYAVGQKPCWEAAAALAACAPEFHVIGDCRQTANIAQAVRGAYYAARNIGRI